MALSPPQGTPSCQGQDYLCITKGIPGCCASSFRSPRLAMDGLHLNSVYVRKMIIYLTAEIIPHKTTQQREVNRTQQSLGLGTVDTNRASQSSSLDKGKSPLPPLGAQDLIQTTGCRTQIIISSCFDYLYFPPSPRLWEIITRKPIIKQEGRENTCLSTHHRAERSRSLRSLLAV